MMHVVSMLHLPTFAAEFLKRLELLHLFFIHLVHRFRLHIRVVTRVLTFPLNEERIDLRVRLLRKPRSATCATDTRPGRVAREAHELRRDRGARR